MIGGWVVFIYRRENRMHAIASISLLLASALAIVPLTVRFGLPAIIGYMLAGTLIGPHAMALIHDTEVVVEVAEFGIAMLLFVIGLELDPKRLWVLRRSIFGLGSLQVGITAALLAALFWAWGESPGVCLIAGLGLAMSSTAFALQLLAEKNQLSARHGRKAFSILLFQDIAVIPLLAIMPLMAGISPDLATELPDPTKVALAIGFLFLASRFLVRPAFRFIASCNTPELFTGAALFIIFGVTWLMTSVHMSTSLGAFLAGVLLADSEYRHELEAQIQPFKKLLLGLFFMAVGMTANLPLLWQEWPLILSSALGLIVLKGAVLWGIGWFTSRDHQIATRLAVTLPQGGEFAFIIFTSAVSLGLMGSALSEELVLIVTLSMALTPLGFWVLERVLEPRWQASQEKREFDTIEDGGEHDVLIAGFGRFGQIVARVLHVHRINFIALEGSPRRVDFVRRFGSKVYYGRSNNLRMLKAAGIEKTKLVVLAIDNIEESVATARIIRQHFPNKPIYARARDRLHAYRLMDLGVTLVQRETYLSSLEMARDVLIGTGLPPERAEESVRRFRAYDDKLIKRQQAIYQNEAALIESAKQAMTELENLFASDHDEPVGNATGDEDDTVTPQGKAG